MLSVPEQADPGSHVIKSGRRKRHPPAGINPASSSAFIIETAAVAVFNPRSRGAKRQADDTVTV